MPENPNLGKATIAYNLLFGAVATLAPASLGGGFLFPFIGWVLYIFFVNCLWVFLLLPMAFYKVLRSGLLKAVFMFIFRRKQFEEMHGSNAFSLDDNPEQLFASSSWPLIVVPFTLFAAVSTLYLWNEGFSELLLIAGGYLAFGAAGFFLARTGRLAPLPMELGSG